MQQQWHLSALYDDERYDQFMGLFHRTIAESASDRYESVEELLAAFREITASFAIHPGTTLRRKVPELRQHLSAPSAVLERLEPQEWRDC